MALGAGNTSPTVEVDGGPDGSATGGTATNVLVVGPAPAHSCGPLSTSCDAPSRP